MTPDQQIQAIRNALVAGPTSGIWQEEDIVIWSSKNDAIAVCENNDGNARKNTTYIAACNPLAITALLARLDAAEDDVARLDFMESHGRNWMARQSVMGRGYRVHQSRYSEHKTAREAIDAARAQEGL